VDESLARTTLDTESMVPCDEDHLGIHRIAVGTKAFDEFSKLLTAVKERSLAFSDRGSVLGKDFRYCLNTQQD
jgi:hypothetical protein